MKAHVVVQRHRVYVGVDAVDFEQCGQRGGEGESVGGVGEIKRLDPQPVAYQHQSATLTLVDREREHALQASDAVGAPGVVCLEDDLGVAAGKKPVAERDEFVAQLAVIVDAAVEDDVEAEVWVRHRLLRLLAEIDHLQAAVTQRDAVEHQAALAVRPARGQLVGHASEQRLVNSSVSGRIEPSDTAHTYLANNYSC